MFYITISNGLLKDNHRKRMGSSVWEFMWLIDKITKIDDKGVGKVLGGKPVKLEEIAKDLGVHINTVSENLINLEKEGYIIRKIAPYGIIIYVNKAKKRFTKKHEPLTENRFTEKGEPRTEKGEPISQKTVNLIKTVSVDNTKDISTKVDSVTVYGDADINKCIDYLKEKLGGSPDGGVKQNRQFCRLLLQRFKKDYPNRDPVDLITKLIDFGLTDDFHGKNITSFKYLYYQAQKIIQSIRAKSQKTNKKVIFHK